jgi:hypothetical protein
VIQETREQLGSQAGSFITILSWKLTKVTGEIQKFSSKYSFIKLKGTPQALPLKNPTTSLYN